MLSQASGQQTFSVHCGTCKNCILIFAYILFCCLLAKSPSCYGGHSNAAMDWLRIQRTYYKFTRNLLPIRQIFRRGKWRRKGKRQLSGMKEAEVQASLCETQRESTFVQWHVCKSGHWEYALALLRPILMMQFEAVEEEIEFSQIEKLS